MPDQEAARYQEEKGIALITLNRPQALNALNIGFLQRLSRLLDQVWSSDAVRAVVIAGAGDAAFSAGADIEAELPGHALVENRSARGRRSLR